MLPLLGSVGNHPIEAPARAILEAVGLFESLDERFIFEGGVEDGNGTRQTMACPPPKGLAQRKEFRERD